MPNVSRDARMVAQNAVRVFDAFEVHAVFDFGFKIGQIP